MFRTFEIQARSSQRSLRRNSARGGYAKRAFGVGAGSPCMMSKIFLHATLTVNIKRIVQPLQMKQDTREGEPFSIKSRFALSVEEVYVREDGRSSRQRCVSSLLLL